MFLKFFNEPVVIIYIKKGFSIDHKTRKFKKKMFVTRQPYLTTAGLVLATECKKNIDLCLQSQKKVISWFFALIILDLIYPRILSENKKWIKPPCLSIHINSMASVFNYICQLGYCHKEK